MFPLRVFSHQVCPANSCVPGQEPRAAGREPRTAPTTSVWEEAVTDTNSSHPRNDSIPAQEEKTSPDVTVLEKNLEQWLRLGGVLGAVVLLCTALLAPFAGSLIALTSSTTSSQPIGPATQTQRTAGGYTITLHVTPATSGTNTFVVTVKNAQGQPETGAGVTITTTMLDMYMRAETTQLQADPKQPGVYSQQADLTMAGRWKVDVRILPATSNSFVKATFDFSASA